MHHVHFRFKLPATSLYHCRVILEKVEEKLAQYHQGNNEQGFNHERNDQSQAELSSTPF